MDTNRSLRKTRVEQRRFLSEWVNLRDDSNALNGFWAKYKAWFRDGAFGLAGIWEARATDGWGGSVPTQDYWEQARNKSLLEIRDLMRAAWEIPELHQRAWKLQPLRDRFNRLSAPTEEDLNQPPPPNDADDALALLYSIARKLKLCDNPDCKTERYLIGVKKLPRFCSFCADQSRAIYKSNWWKDNKQRINPNRKRDHRKRPRKRSAQRIALGKRSPA